MGTDIGIEKKTKGKAYLWFGRYYRVAPEGWTIDITPDNINEAISDVEKTIEEHKKQVLSWMGYVAPTADQHAIAVNNVENAMDDLHEECIKLAKLIIIRNALDDGFKIIIG